MAYSEPSKEKTQSVSLPDELVTPVSSGEQSRDAEASNEKFVSWAEHVVNFVWRKSSELSSEERAVQQFVAMVIDPKGNVWNREQLEMMANSVLRQLIDRRVK